MKKYTIAFLCCAFLLVSLNSSIKATIKDDNKNTKMYQRELLVPRKDSLNSYTTISNNNQLRSGVGIFIAGIAVGWIVGGVIEWSTGKSPESWTASVIDEIIDAYNHGASRIEMMKNGEISAIYNSSSCIWTGSSWQCPYKKVR